MNTLPNHPSLMDARIAHFASDEVLSEHARHAVYRQLGTEALRTAASVPYFDLWGSQKHEELDISHITNVESQQQAGIEADQLIHAEAALLDAFTDFLPELSKLRQDIETGTAHAVGAGKHSSVYAIEKDGKTYVARVINSPFKPSQEVVHKHLASGVRTNQAPGFERFVAGSFSEGLVISEFVRGEHMKDIEPADITAIPDEHIEALISSRMNASLKGIVFDNVQGNLLYDKETGFTNIDFEIGDDPLDAVNAMAGIFSSLELSGEEILAAAKGEFSIMAERKEALETRLKSYIDTHFNAADREVLEDRIRRSKVNNIVDAKMLLGAVKPPTGQ